MTVDDGGELPMRGDTDPTTMLEHAGRVQSLIRRGGRWYPAMMGVYGLFTVGLVACIPLARNTWAGITFGLVVVACAVGIFWWKHRQTLRPASRRDTQRWVVAWVVLYTVAVGWFGPRYLDHAPGWWAVMGLVVAVPAFAEAGRAWVRVRQ